MDKKERNIKVIASILDILAKNKCTVEDTCLILGFVELEVRKTATVTRIDCPIHDDDKDYQKQIAKLAEKITVLEEKVKDGKTFVVTDSACDINDIARIVAARLDIKTIIND